MSFETLRTTLIKWNVAPLFIAAFLCYCGYVLLQSILDPACDKTEWYVGILAGLLTGLFGFIYKIYDSLQTNRGGK